GLGLEELLDSLATPLTAVTRLLVAAERRVDVGRRTVEVNHARAQAPRDAPRVLDVAGVNVAREAVHRIVRDPHRFFLVAIRNHHQHRSEDFLARDRHGVVDIREPGPPITTVAPSSTPFCSSRWIFSNCVLFATGPIVVPSAFGSPTTGFSATD